MRRRMGTIASMTAFIVASLALAVQPAHAASQRVAVVTASWDFDSPLTLIDDDRTVTIDRTCFGATAYTSGQLPTAGACGIQQIVTPVYSGDCVLSFGNGGDLGILIGGVVHVSFRNGPEIAAASVSVLVPDSVCNESTAESFGVRSDTKG